MSNPIYSPNYILTQRSSGYKSSIYAVAELLDNSIDAEASEIEFLLNEISVKNGPRRRNVLSDIVIADNGQGMNYTQINDCLTLSKGSGESSSRIGKFGVGLLQSSIFVGKRVEVYSRHKSENVWRKVIFDIDESINKTNVEYESAIESEPPSFISNNISEDVRTIVHWSKLDRLDVTQSKTFINRAEKLFGRIYRYKIIEGLKISLKSFSDFKGQPIINSNIIPYDPLFLMSGETYISKKIWEAIDKNISHKKLNKFEQFRSKYHFSKFIKDCEPYKSSLPIFQKDESAFDVVENMTINGEDYWFKIRASFAYSSITKPGIRDGGSTIIGEVAREKMNGSRHFSSANIFFIRNGREIDYGNYGFYNNSEEVARWWTIEIHFDSKLDDILGLSNNKQSVEFVQTLDRDLDTLHIFDDMTLPQIREYVWNKITMKILRSIKRMKGHLRDYARNFIDEENKYLDDSGGKNPVPVLEQPIIDLIAKSKSKWSAERKEEMYILLKEAFMKTPEHELREQIEIFSRDLLKTLVIYAPNESGNLFEIKEPMGQVVILINKNHEYYTSVVEPLKNNVNLKEYAIAIEMLLSSLAFEYHHLLAENKDKYEIYLKNFIDGVSRRLGSYIQEIKLDFEKENNNHDEFDDDLE